MRPHDIAIIKIFDEQYTNIVNNETKLLKDINLEERHVEDADRIDINQKGIRDAYVSLS